MESRSYWTRSRGGLEHVCYEENLKDLGVVQPGEVSRETLLQLFNTYGMFTSKMETHFLPGYAVTG